MSRRADVLAVASFYESFASLLVHIFSSISVLRAALAVCFTSVHLGHTIASTTRTHQTQTTKLCLTPHHSSRTPEILLEV
jgi:hypothetical protein